MKKKLEIKEKYSGAYLLICVSSVVLLLISNITSVKLFQIGKIILPSSALLFPLTYIIGDLISEVYGFKKARKIIALGFAFNAFMVCFFALTIALPSASTWSGQAAYKMILGTTPRMFIASLVAYLVGSMSNAYVMDIVKKITKGKYLAVRTISSTIVGEFLDTLLFATIGFAVTLPSKAIISMIVCQFIWKVSYEIIATPFTYLAVNKFKKIEKEN